MPQGTQDSTDLVSLALSQTPAYTARPRMRC